MPPAVVPWFVAVSLPEWSRPARTLVRLAEWCHRFTPRVHLEPPDREVAGGAPLVLLDASGCLRANGGAARLAARLCRGLARRGIVHAAGSAPTGGEAVVRATAAGLWVAAGARPPLDPPPVDRLPIEALRLPDECCAALHEVNLRHVGELRAVARPSLVDRHGPLVAERLDMAAGMLPWPFRPVPAPSPVSGEFEFASPCAQREAVDLACREAIARLCAALEARGRGASALTVRLRRARLPPVAGTVHFGAPTRDPAHLWSILAPRLERVHLGEHELGQGIERIELVARRLGRCAGGTPFLAGALGTAAADAATERGGDDRAASTERTVGELLDRLRARLGDGAAHAPADAIADAAPRAQAAPHRPSDS